MGVHEDHIHGCVAFAVRTFLPLAACLLASRNGALDALL
jgi:hypothetical protein